MATTQQYSINDIQDEMREAGSHWWDPGAMKSFGTQIESGVYQGPGGICFVSSEQPPHGPRAYAVRKYDPDTQQISGRAAEYDNLDDAIAAAEEYAETDDACDDEFEPVSEIDQFEKELRDHGCKGVTATRVVDMVKLAKRHQRFAAIMCGDGSINQEAKAKSAEKQIQPVKMQIGKLAKSLGCEGAVLGGDPRGCTVKLLLPDGATNDWGGEGWCVPMPE